MSLVPRSRSSRNTKPYVPKLSSRDKVRGILGEAVVDDSVQKITVTPTEARRVLNQVVDAKKGYHDKLVSNIEKFSNLERSNSLKSKPVLEALTKIRDTLSTAKNPTVVRQIIKDVSSGTDTSSTSDENLSRLLTSRNWSGTVEFLSGLIITAISTYRKAISTIEDMQDNGRLERSPLSMMYDVKLNQLQYILDNLSFIVDNSPEKAKAMVLASIYQVYSSLVGLLNRIPSSNQAHDLDLLTEGQMEYNNIMGFLNPISDMFDSEKSQRAFDTLRSIIWFLISRPDEYDDNHNDYVEPAQYGPDGPDGPDGPEPDPPEDFEFVDQDQRQDEDQEEEDQGQDRNQDLLHENLNSDAPKIYIEFNNDLYERIKSTDNALLSVSDAPPPFELSVKSADADDESNVGKVLRFNTTNNPNVIYIPDDGVFYAPITIFNYILNPSNANMNTLMSNSNDNISWYLLINKITSAEERVSDVWQYLPTDFLTLYKLGQENYRDKDIRSSFIDIQNSLSNLFVPTPQGRGTASSLSRSTNNHTYIDEDSFERGILRILRGGVALVNQAYDDDFVRLLNKRYSSKHPYSASSIDLYRKAVNILGADTLGLKPSSSKWQLVFKKSAKPIKGGKVVFANQNVNDLFDNLTINLGSIAAGNNSKHLLAETEQLVDLLVTKKAFSYEDGQAILTKYHIR